MKMQNLAAAMLAAAAVTGVAHAQTPGTVYVSTTNNTYAANSPNSGTITLTQGAIESFSAAGTLNSTTFANGYGANGTNVTDGQSLTRDAAGNVLVVDPSQGANVSNVKQGSVLGFNSTTGAYFGTASARNGGTFSAYNGGGGINPIDGSFIVTTSGTPVLFVKPASLTNAYAANAVASPFTGAIGAADVVFDASGNVYFTQTMGGNGTVLEFAPTTGATTIANSAINTFSFGSIGGTLNGLAIDPLGDIFVTVGGTTGSILEYNALTKSASTFYSGGLLSANPQDLAFTSLGTLLVANGSGNNILQFATTAVGSVPTVFAATTSAAYGITIAPLVAAPEPSQNAALGLGMLGLTGLIVTARKRRASVCA